MKLSDRLDNLRSLPYTSDQKKRASMTRETREYLMPALQHRSGIFLRLNDLLQRELDLLQKGSSTGAASPTEGPGHD